MGRRFLGGEEGVRRRRRETPTSSGETRVGGEFLLSQGHGQNRKAKGARSKGVAVYEKRCIRKPHFRFVSASPMPGAAHAPTRPQSPFQTRLLRLLLLLLLPLGPSSSSSSSSSPPSISFSPSTFAPSPPHSTPSLSLDLDCGRCRGAQDGTCQSDCEDDEARLELRSVNDATRPTVVSGMTCARVAKLQRSSLRPRPPRAPPPKGERNATVSFPT